ncbi:hypothetical protein [Desulfosporosinus sp. BICA1-9]|uniref:hypothetical protein n=1 Tax=Desulfosporosinus sp. BICA1-9 TaxID=1531958 RepID=UPI00054C642B|nr:hypothetical protein [Desulfosporosinus sp. BICA1-9]KJS46378.1 MAG: hypothetical protein VR66_25670 [Peptococcaceae bacterium BRH_c23]KJS86493.1 MAG: hypothetical protein JL57_16285 [Desulfosporosinus sp. BICA1-9]HBW35585.1 hypothetical protein [Desulfosporosinus sp.]
MQVLVCIDDTDNLESRGTGELASILAQVIEEQGWGKSFGVTRHQLLVHEDIPYTSHNSSMCFVAELKEDYLNRLIQFASDFLVHESAEGSDPGLCVLIPEKLSQREKLIMFGRKAKEVVLTKQDAYDLAKHMGIHLSEHGGTGQGVIGALAGVALRLSGTDGRFKGKLKIKSDAKIISVGEILSQTNVDAVKSLDGMVLKEDDLVELGDTLKAILMEGKCVLPVTAIETSESEGVRWQTCTKQQVRKF